MSGCVSVCTQTTRTRRPHTAARIKTHTVREPIAYDSDEPTRSLTSPALKPSTHTRPSAVDASCAGCELGVARIHIHIHIHSLGSSMGTGTWLAISRYLTQKGHRAKQVVDFGLVASRRRKRYRPLAAHNLL